MSGPPLYLLSEQKQSLVISSLPTPAALCPLQGGKTETETWRETVERLKDSDRKEEIGTQRHGDMERSA